MPFSPTDLSDLKLWLKADAITGLSDGDPVTTWADSSGNGQDATQGTAGNKPTYKTGIQNGLPVVRFDGTTDYLTTTFGAALTQPVTIFFVASITSGADDHQFFHSGIEAFDILTGLGFYAGSSVTESLIRPLTMSIMGGLVNGASTVWRRGGVQRASGNAGSSSMSGTLNIGRHAAGTKHMQGDYAELIVWDADHSASYSDIETYLGRWFAAPGGLTPRSRRRVPGLVYR